MPTILNSSEGLKELIDDLEKHDRICAIDTEADSLHRYKESLCLIQFSAAGKNVLIDPLAIKDLTSLDDYLSQCEVWMHGADYDMTMLKREFNRLPPLVWDTQIGARLLGLKSFGLSDLVEHWFGVSLLKTSQKADWGRRPLTDKMLDYAINDVIYLLPLGESIVEELIEMERYDWFVESCHAARHKVMQRNESRMDAWRINGCGRLNERGLSYLKDLWEWREEEASLWDKPTFMVLNNKDMILFAEILSNGVNPTIPRQLMRPDRLKRFQAAIANASMRPNNDWPEKLKAPKRKKDSAFEREIDLLIKKRNHIASTLTIEPSLIVSRGTAEALIANEITPQDALMNWQQQLLEF